MRKRTLRRALILLAPGCLLWLSCPSGTLLFLGTASQPALATFLLDFANALSGNLFGGNGP